MTFKELSKKISNSNTPQQQTRLFDLFNDKPFWIWNAEQHKQEDINTKGDCCFNHLISLPTKNGEEKPLFDYEKLLYGSLLDNDCSNALNHRLKVLWWDFLTCLV